MKYVSMFVTILFVWIAIILMAITRTKAQEIFELYLGAMASTLILFLIGFAKK